ncbi:IS256 family transposase [Fulvivirga kasyanovii]|uniref:Mutator family transposase n=2 Tax=Fulvivirga kasyanovii TaxID=396812 RepID=A0ABW9RJ15_9BACT|nr:IS256 family transposase [Fulvivirga kasyanovii]MTI23418.1 IS256 family transposase [Fulvivirga kasyanovii]
MNDDKLNIPPDFFKKFSKEEFNSFFDKLFKEGVQQMLQGEMEEHLGYSKYQKKDKDNQNTRNGISKKNVKTSRGSISVDIPRDREATFEPRLIPKHKRMSEEIEDAILSLYAKGMSTADIEEQIGGIYGVEISATTVSNVTARMLEAVKTWQSRPLDQVYFIVWMDGISFKVRQNGKVINKTIYLMIGLNNQGTKEVLGMWLHETESASFWMSVFTDIKARGVEDIFIVCSDNLTGLTDGISSIYPQAVTQVCVVHQIRNSLKYVVWKDKKAFMADLKQVYQAPTRQAAEMALQELAQKWQHKYGYAIKSWVNNWDNLTHFFDFPLEIRKVIYTTNVIESFNSTLRKYTRNRLVFPNDEAVYKALYMAIDNITRKWTQTVRNWGLIMSQFINLYADRCRM